MKLALAGDTMLGRKVGERLAVVPPTELFADEIVEIVHEADHFLLNLECAISDRGERWPDPSKPFFFRAPPVAVDVLTHLGVDAVTLANNHALDYGPEALLDTIRLLRAAGIGCVGAGADVDDARAPFVLEHDGTSIGLLGVTDHPADFAATMDRPGTAYANLRHGMPAWLLDATRELARRSDIAVVTPHWGPNMVPAPVGHVPGAAAALLDAGATLVAGHSAHVFHGVSERVVYDLGDFIDDYATNPVLRNDLGLLFLVTFEGRRPVRLEAVPLKLDFCTTRLAEADDRSWISARFRLACETMGTDVVDDGDRLVVAWKGRPATA